MNIESVSLKQLTELRKRLRRWYWKSKPQETIPLEFNIDQVKTEIKRRKALNLRTAVKETT